MCSKQMAPEDIKADDLFCRHPIILAGTPLVTSWTAISQYIGMLDTRVQAPVTPRAFLIVSTPEAVKFHFERELNC